jgi:hypothetical protein
MRFSVHTGIGAEAKRLFGGGQMIPAAANFARQGAQNLSIGQIAQNVPAALAPRVLEIKQLAAVLAFEQLHAAFLTQSGPLDVAQPEQHQKASGCGNGRPGENSDISWRRLVLQGRRPSLQ